MAVTRKEDKYTALSINYNFSVIALEILALETLASLRTKTSTFLRELGRRLPIATGDTRETAFLFQRLSIAVRRFDAICIRNRADNGSMRHGSMGQMGHIF